jgi:NADH-quinone oxidoreductase subunit D
MEELIHHFIIATQGIDAPAGEVYFSAENPKGELGFYIQQHRRRRAASPQDPQPLLPESQHLSKLLPGHMISDTLPCSAASIS